MPRSSRETGADKRRPKTYKQPYWLVLYNGEVRFSSNSVSAVASYINESSADHRPVFRLQFFSGELGKFKPRWEGRIDHMFSDIEYTCWLVASHYAFIHSYNENIDKHDDGWYASLNVNDTFAYASADAESFQLDQAAEIVSLAQRYGGAGVTAWAAHHRGAQPIDTIPDDEKYIAAMGELHSGSVPPPAPINLNFHNSPEERIKFIEEVFMLMTDDKVELYFDKDELVILDMKTEKEPKQFKPKSEFGSWPYFAIRFQPVAEPARPQPQQYHQINYRPDYSGGYGSGLRYLDEPNYDTYQIVRIIQGSAAGYYSNCEFRLRWRHYSAPEVSVALPPNLSIGTTRDLEDAIRHITEAMMHRFMGQMMTPRTAEAMADFFEYNFSQVYRDVMQTAPNRYDPFPRFTYR